jgi:hypothetical protein
MASTSIAEEKEKREAAMFDSDKWGVRCQSPGGVYTTLVFPVLAIGRIVG